MRIAVIGGGPAGLYFALLMKKLDPGHDIVVVEQNAAGATYGFGVVFSEKALAFHEAGDPETYQLITPKAEAWDDLAIVHRDRRIPIDGNGFAAMGRLELLRLFHDACRAAGIAIEFGKRVDGLDRFGDYDLVVGADGAGSIVREIHARFFRPKRQVLSNKFAWYGTRQWFETLTLTFRTNADGAFVAHHYRYSPEMSTFIVECDAGTWDRAGFARMRDDESRRYCEQVFAPDLGGHRLIDNKSMWRSFPILTNDNWRHDKLVLIGDALRTVHFSIGSGTRLAMEDALALYSAFRDAGPAVKRALARFEETRRPIVDKLLRAAANSAMWYERFHEIMHLDPHDLVYSYMTRTGRVDEPGLRKIAPRFMAGFDAHRAAKAPPAGSRIAASPADAPVDALGDDSPGAREIGFSPPQRYNASDILFRNLEAGRAAKAAIYCNGKTTTYGELCALANRIGRALIGLGLGRGERVLLVLDDTPVYAGAIFGALKAGFVPVLTNTLSTKDLLEYFIQDGQAPVAIVEGRLVGLLRDAGRQCPSLGCVVCVGEPSHEIGVRTLDWQAWTAAASPDLDAADTSRDDMAFWMYSSGTTGRPKGVVHLHHDMLYTYESYGKHVLGIRADDVVFSVPKLFFAYGFGNSITFPFSVGGGGARPPGRPDPNAGVDCNGRESPT
ncbi:MAG: AMP-binding protein, partial [Pseudomonadota bacterium]